MEMTEIIKVFLDEGDGKREITNLKLDGISLHPGSSVVLELQAGEEYDGVQASLLLYDEGGDDPIRTVDLKDCIPYEVIPCIPIDLRVFLDRLNDPFTVVNGILEQTLAPLCSVEISYGFDRNEAEATGTVLFGLALNNGDNNTSFSTTGDCQIAEVEKFLALSATQSAP
jgi:hypothetical protein